MNADATSELREGLPTAVAAFVTDAAFYLALFALTHALESAGSSSRGVALVFGIYNLAYAVSAPLLGRLSDRRRFQSVVAGASLFAAVYTILALTLRLQLEAGQLVVEARVASPQVLAYSAMAILALANALFWPALQARIGDRVADSAALTRAIRVFNLAWTTGKAGGFVVAALLFVGSPQLCLWLVVGGAWIVVGAVLSEGRVPAKERSGTGTGTGTLEPVTDPPSRIPQETKRAFLLAGLLSNFVLWGAMATMTGLAPKLAKGWGLDVRETGVLLALALSAQGVAFLALGSGDRWAYRRAGLVIVLPASCAALALLALTTNLWLALLGATLIGAGQAVTYASSVFYSLDYDERRGMRTGIHEAVLALGGALPILGGQLADWSGNELAPVWLVLGLAAPAALAIVFLLRNARVALEKGCAGAAS